MNWICLRRSGLIPQRRMEGCGCLCSPISEWSFNEPSGFIVMCQNQQHNIEVCGFIINFGKELFNRTDTMYRQCHQPNGSVDCGLFALAFA